MNVLQGQTGTLTAGERASLARSALDNNFQSRCVIFAPAIIRYLPCDPRYVEPVKPRPGYQFRVALLPLEIGDDELPNNIRIHIDADGKEVRKMGTTAFRMVQVEDEVSVEGADTDGAEEECTIEAPAFTVDDPTSIDVIIVLKLSTFQGSLDRVVELVDRVVSYYRAIEVELSAAGVRVARDCRLTEKASSKHDAYEKCGVALRIESDERDIASEQVVIFCSATGNRVSVPRCDLVAEVKRLLLPQEQASVCHK